MALFHKDRCCCITAHCIQTNEETLFRFHHQQCVVPSLRHFGILYIIMKKTLFLD